jgi:hypothetical protein
MIAGVAEDEARDSVATLLPSRDESERVALDTVSALSEACPRLSTTSGQGSLTPWPEVVTRVLFWLINQARANEC